jgi:hypothetical protein
VPSIGLSFLVVYDATVAKSISLPIHKFYIRHVGRTNALAYFGGNEDDRTVFVITGDDPVPARHVRISVDGGSDSSRKLRNARSSKWNGGTITGAGKPY